jgi:hypothetical protein
MWVKILIAKWKKSLKIPKGQSESVYRRRTDNTMAKRKKVQKGKEDIYWIGAETTNRSLLTSVSLVEQELPTLPEDLGSPSGF